MKTKSRTALEKANQPQQRYVKAGVYNLFAIASRIAFIYMKCSRQ